METIRWGILGPGHIARKFADAVHACEGAELIAVASSSLQRANDFASRYGISKAYGSYEALLQDPDVDAVYIAAINSMHLDLIRKSAEAGKAILCEKPLVMTEADAVQVQQLAEQHRVLIMEALWSNFLPAAATAKQWIAAGKIGTVRHIHANSIFRDDGSCARLFDKSMGGGALLDIGVYSLSFFREILQCEPSSCHAMAQFSQSGVDTFASVTLGYPDGTIADCHFGITMTMPPDAIITGEKGYIFMPGFWMNDVCELYDNERCLLQRFEGDGSNGFIYEIRHFDQLIREGKTESDVMPLSRTRDCAHLFDVIRSKWQ